MNGNKWPRIITWALLIMLSALTAVLIYNLLSDRDEWNNRFDTLFTQPKEVPKNGYTPIKGIDYFDGVNGQNGSNGIDGADGVDGYTPKKGVDYWDGIDGADGRDAYFEIQCNEKKNRWEVRYASDDNFQVLNGHQVKCLGV